MLRVRLMAVDSDIEFRARAGVVASTIHDMVYSVLRDVRKCLMNYFIRFHGVFVMASIITNQEFNGSFDL